MTSTDPYDGLPVRDEAIRTSVVKVAEVVCQTAQQVQWIAMHACDLTYTRGLDELAAQLTLLPGIQQVIVDGVGKLLHIAYHPAMVNVEAIGRCACRLGYGVCSITAYLDLRDVPAHIDYRTIEAMIRQTRGVLAVQLDWRNAQATVTYMPGLTTIFMLHQIIAGTARDDQRSGPCDEAEYARSALAVRCFEFVPLQSRRVRIDGTQRLYEFWAVQGRYVYEVRPQNSSARTQQHLNRTSAHRFML